MLKMTDLIGRKIKSTVAADTATKKAPRDHRIAEIWGPNENGEYVAWSVGPSGGEHLRGTSEEALVRRVMGLA